MKEIFRLFTLKSRFVPVFVPVSVLQHIAGSLQLVRRKMIVDKAIPSSTHEEIASTIHIPKSQTKDSGQSKSCKVFEIVLNCLEQSHREVQKVSGVFSSSRIHPDAICSVTTRSLFHLRNILFNNYTAPLTLDLH